MTMRNLLLLLLCSISAVAARSQDKWNLRQCVEYAWANNISIKQSDVQARFAEIQLKQNKWGQYPTANFSTTTGLQWGRSIDPTTNQFTSSQLLSQSFGLSAGVDIFNWHRIRNNILSARYESDASRADVEKVKNDIALSVATYYLQVLLARQQVDVAKVQMGQTLSQLELTRKKVNAGALPQLDQLSLEGQYATDSANYISTQATADINLLQLKAVLNVDAGKPFDIETPPIDKIPMDPILALQPEDVFATAIKNQPAQKANELRLKSLQAAQLAAKGAFYPTISLGGNLGTNFASAGKQVSNISFTGYAPSNPSSPVTNINGVLYPIVNPSYDVEYSKKTFGETWTGWGTQVNNNFRQNVGVTISVPILNSGAAKFNYERAKLNVKNIELTRELADQQLKNDIYQAYYNASAAMQKYEATKRTVAATQKAYDFASRRYQLGLLSTFDLITSQNNLNRSKLDLVYTQFDYVFKMKVLEFYKGLGLRL